MTGRFLLALFAAAAALSLLAAPAPAQLSDTTQFMKAVRERDAEKAMALISAPGSIVVNSRDRGTGEAALHVLTRERDLVWVGYLLGKGARPDIQDKNGMTPLGIATQIGWLEGADRLLRGGAKVDFPNAQGETPLILAVHNRDINMVKLLLGRGADPKRGDTVAGYSALDYARRDGRNPAMIKALEAPPAPVKRQGPSL